MSGAIRNAVREHPVWSFLFVTFGWSFGVDAVAYVVQGPSGPMIALLPRAWGPLVGGAAVTYALGDDVRAWAGQATNWRVRPLLYVLAVALPVLAGEADVAVQAAASVPVAFAPVSLPNYVVGFLVVLLLAGSLEEFGWRGFAQPRLQRSYAATTSAVGVGVAWALWHLPLFFLFDYAVFDPGTFHWYVLGIVGLSVVYAWLYNESGGSVLLPMVAHAVHNQPGLFEATGAASGAVARASTAAPDVVEAALGACVVLVCGYRALCRSDRDATAVGVPGVAASDPE